MKQDGVLLENLLTSTEIFDTETETWSDGPELPISLAFATVVSTPLATFIMGGQTVGGDPSSATGKSFSEALILASAKGQIISKRFFLAEDSSKKRTKTRRILVKTNSFVRFLEESSA